LISRSDSFRIQWRLGIQSSDSQSHTFPHDRSPAHPSLCRVSYEWEERGRHSRHRQLTARPKRRDLQRSQGRLWAPRNLWGLPSAPRGYVLRSVGDVSDRRATSRSCDAISKPLRRGESAHMSVAIYPGHMALTWTLCLLHSLLSAFVSWASPPLAAAYAGTVIPPYPAWVLLLVR
jgi:hypothetical protein